MIGIGIFSNKLDQVTSLYGWVLGLHLIRAPPLFGPEATPCVSGWQKPVAQMMEHQPCGGLA